MTNKKTIDDTGGWDTQTEWEAYQSKDNITISSGVLSLLEASYPSSMVMRYDAGELSGYIDGQTVSTWPDSAGSYDLSAGGDPTYVASGLNSQPVVDFDGSDYFSEGAFSQSQPCAASAVVETDSTGPQYVSDGQGTNRQIAAIADADGETSGAGPGAYAGSWLSGASSVSGSGYVLLTWVFNGASSAVRVNGGDVLTGDLGSSSISGGLTLGVGSQLGKNFLDGRIAEYIRYGDITEVDHAETKLNAEWGVY